MESELLQTRNLSYGYKRQESGFAAVKCSYSSRMSVLPLSLFCPLKDYSLICGLAFPVTFDSNSYFSDGHRVGNMRDGKVEHLKNLWKCAYLTLYLDK